MAIVCPAILAATPQQYHDEIAKIAHSAHRIQIDLTDEVFATSKTVTPAQAWWPVGFKADFHLMYKNPMPAVKIIMEHRPNLVIVHAESEGNFLDIVKFCQQHEVMAGVALLPQTSLESILPALPAINHVLIFSGDLGNYGGRADLRLLEKVSYLKSHKPAIEVGWDGGINDQNVAALVDGGVDVLNVGGYIQNSPDPARAYSTLSRIADETGSV